MRRRMHALIISLAIGCGKTAPSPTPQTHAARDPGSATIPTVLPAPSRLIGFADVHGDLNATRAVLKLAGLIDENDGWTGGDTVVVQTGDQLDRGDDEQAILDLFERLSDESRAAGGGFYPLLGNHEILNVALDLRYITAGGFTDFTDTPYEANDPELKSYPESQRGRIAAFRPGGPYANVLAQHNMPMMVGDTVFVHGGILPEHARIGLESINADVQAWMRGDAQEPERWTRSRTSPAWSRHYSNEPDAADCALLSETLSILGAQRMVVGHTVQKGANAACDGKVWRMDVGMAAHYGGRPAALEIVGNTIQLLQ